MLVIRMQRTGRKGHAMFRVVVQDSRRTPSSGKVVASLGSYDPHAKQLQLNTERAKFYLDHGAQPSDRVARLLKTEGIALPAWVKLESDKARTVRNADKRRSTTPPAPVEEAPEEVPAAAADAETEAEAPEAAPAEAAPAPAEETPAEPEIAEETPAADKAE
jgi:small subunit ribosomal protein S16